jgi:hypothetical protein
MKSMKLKNDEIINELNQLREIIFNEDIKEIAMADEEIKYMVENAQRWGHFWGGADVIINTR